MTKQELTYWHCLAEIAEISSSGKNQIYKRCFLHNPRYSIIDLFEQPAIWEELGLSSREQSIFATARTLLPRYADEVNALLAQGYNLVPIHSPAYPLSLKQNLRIRSPVLLYTRGNPALLNSAAAAIVGSRSADAVALTFTANAAAKTVAEGLTVVSGFARGVDRQALDSALQAGGSSIVVLPQGITTFSSGFRQYHNFIVSGRVLIVSAFTPRAPWAVGLAMARNAYIYGLAEKVYVAWSNFSGGTSGQGSGKALKCAKKFLSAVLSPGKIVPISF